MTLALDVYEQFGKMAPIVPLTHKQIEKMKKEFLLLDADGDGTISVNELGSVLRSMKGKLRASEADIKRALREIDRDGDGTVDLKEYIKHCKNKTNADLVHRALVQRSNIRKEFERFDEDGSGYITQEELLQVIQARAAVTVTKEQVQRMMADSDDNNDGQINYEEFVLLMTK